LLHSLLYFNVGGEESSIKCRILTVEMAGRKTKKIEEMIVLRKGKVLALILASICIFSFTATSCGSKVNNSKKSITVAGVVFQEDQFMQMLNAGYKAAAKDEGVNYVAGNSSNDVGKEAQLVQTYVAEGLSGIDIAPLNPDTSLAALKAADKAGVKISVTNIVLNNAPFVVGSNASDNKQLGNAVGKEAHEFIASKLGGKANVAILEFKSQFPAISTERVDGFKEALSGLDIKYVADQDAWVQDAAVQKASEILTAHPEVNIIYGANDGGTIGSVMAVRNKGMAGKTFVYGIDVGLQQIDMLKASDNVMQAVEGQDPYTLGYNSMKVLIDAIKTGKEPMKGKDVIVPGVTLNRSNTDAIDKYQAQLTVRLGS
jgi:ABC-type sugar transport system substrate-binding protein